MVVLCECCLVVVVRWVVVVVGSACEKCCLAAVGLACCMSVDLQVVSPVSPEPTCFGMLSEIGSQPRLRWILISRVS